MEERDSCDDHSVEPSNDCITGWWEGNGKRGGQLVVVGFTETKINAKSSKKMEEAKTFLRVRKYKEKMRCV